MRKGKLAMKLIALINIIILASFGCLSQFNDKNEISNYIRMLDSNNRRIKIESALALKNLSAGSEVALPALYKVLDDNDSSVKLAVLDAIITIGVDKYRSVKEVIPLLHDNDSRIRAKALSLLKLYRDEAMVYKSIIMPMLCDVNQEVRLNAAILLHTIDRNYDEIAENRLRDLVLNGSVFVRKKAISWLGDLKRTNAASTDAVLNALKDDDVGVRYHAMYFLEIRKNMDYINIKLEGNLDSEDELLKCMSVLILSQYGYQSDKFANTVIDMLKSNDSMQEIYSAKAISNMDEPPTNALECLDKIIYRKGQPGMAAAESALVNFGWASFPYLLKYYRSNDVELKRAAARIIYGIGADISEKLYLDARGIKLFLWIMCTVIKDE